MPFGDLLKNGLWKRVRKVKSEEVETCVFFPVWQAAAISNSHFAEARRGCLLETG